MPGPWPARGSITTTAASAFVGVYEFHREDYFPSNVVSLTTDKFRLNSAIAGIWTNYVNYFYSGSRCWDALYMAVTNFPKDKIEQRYIIFVSDGKDNASTTKMTNVVAEAIQRNVRIFAIGFGSAGVDTNSLDTITSGTGGMYYTGTTAADLTAQFAQIGNSLTGQYRLRWATTRRGSTAFMPGFIVTYQGISATNPPNPVTTSSGASVTTNSIESSTRFYRLRGQ